MVSAEDKALEKGLRIKVGTVKRTKKEFDFYLKEEENQRAKVEKMRKDGCDEWVNTRHMGYGAHCLFVFVKYINWG